ncbi:MAG: hypothetical protein ABWZ66_03335 [Pyrinomonadaceae bacterium]
MAKAQKKTTPATKNSQPCSLNLKDSPMIRGLRLEMTKAEVKKEYPLMVFTDDFPKEQVKERDNAGLAKKAQLANSAHKENLESITVLFGNDNRVLTILLLFDSSTYGPTTKDFAGKISESLNLPKNKWEAARGGGNASVLYCDGFAVTVNFSEENKPILFLAKAPDKMTNADRETLKP